MLSVLEALSKVSVGYEKDSKTHKRFSFLLLLALIILGVLSSACNLTIPPSATSTWTTEPPLDKVNPQGKNSLQVSFIAWETAK